MSDLKFTKFSGNGNDFVILDHPSVSLSKVFIARICDRHFGVGADGVLVLSTAPNVDGRMQIFNADGGEAEMCANGLRCLVTYLDEKSATKKDSYSIKTMNATYQVTRKGNSFALEMSELKDQGLYDLSIFKDFSRSFYVNTGVPHLVFLSEKVKDIEIKKVGSHYRYHSLFPRGTNVNFVEIIDETRQSAYVRTYERGVEDETFSCGTGLTAVALALGSWFNWKNDIELTALGGKHIVSLNDKVLFSGEVTRCFEGEISI